MFKHTNKKVTIAADIGGSHIAVALINSDNEPVPGSFTRYPVNPRAGAAEIMDVWLTAFRSILAMTGDCRLKGIGIAMPGPFDYANGVSLINGVNKYHHLYGMNIAAVLRNHLDIPPGLPVVFENDAACFALGESRSGQAAGSLKTIAITLGTGFGAAFIENNRLQKSGSTVPPDGVLFNTPFKNGTAEAYISARWLVQAYKVLSGRQVTEAKEIAAQAYEQNDHHALAVFDTLGVHIAECLVPWIPVFGATQLIIGGNISRAASLFLPAIERVFGENKIKCVIRISHEMEMAAITGAAGLVNQTNTMQTNYTNNHWRKSSQPLLPLQLKKTVSVDGDYDIYPVHSMGTGHIFTGYASLAEWIAQQKNVVIDGYVGNDWAIIRENLSVYFNRRHIPVFWYEAAAFLKPEAVIDTMVEPWLGEAQSVWGKKTTLSLADFFRTELLDELQPGKKEGINIFIGTGAALCNWDAPVVYIDLPKNELQYRMRAGSITNLGKSTPGAPAVMYKRFYFVDWVVLNAHRAAIKSRIAVIADGQWKNEVNWSMYASVRDTLQAMRYDAIRVRPWFEAGAWGGQWLKEKIPALNKAEINYAWSFELIIPENGLVLESDSNLLELAFDWLMEHDCRAVLGDDAAVFGVEFPIRFDFLDTFDGGNLSIQCHPTIAYMQQHFGERITQDETYYILDCKHNAGVYLGFQEDIDPDKFRKELEQSAAENKTVDIEKFVQLHPANKHDLFLIPGGTIHSAGVNNLVLEISATPYIFTFKMYDWLRLDLNGEPRPINIAHAFHNLDFSRKGAYVKRELLSHPVVLEQRDGFRLVHLPTHTQHFYDVHRIEIDESTIVNTKNKCHVLMLVEGEAVTVITKNGKKRRFHYAETFIVPAAAESYQLINETEGTAKIIKAFIK